MLVGSGAVSVAVPCFHGETVLRAMRARDHRSAQVASSYARRGTELVHEERWER